jgi:histidinol-phosphatase (PHP family)
MYEEIMLDYHIHTDHSDDGTTPLRAMVEAAIGKGLREICITSHYDMDAPPGKRCRELDFPAYVADV